MLTINGVVTTATAIVIPNGASFVDIVVTPINDTIPELTPETVIFTINRAITTYRLDPDAADLTATVTITDNEPTVSVVAVDPTAVEPGGTGNTGRFRISRTGSTAAALEVAFKLTGTATSGSDYVSPGTKVTIPAGASFIDVDIEPLIDALVEAPETVILTLAAGKVYSLDSTALSASVTITDGAPIADADLVILSAVIPPKLSNSPPPTHPSKSAPPSRTKVHSPPQPPRRFASFFPRTANSVPATSNWASSPWAPSPRASPPPCPTLSTSPVWASPRPTSAPTSSCSCSTMPTPSPRPSKPTTSSPRPWLRSASPVDAF